MNGNLLPVAVDIETSGVDKVKCGIWQIGAVDLNTMEEFLDEARINDEDEVVNIPGGKPCLEVIGKTEEELRDKNKQSQKQLLEKFFNWVGERKMKNFVCQNPQFDLVFLEIKAKKYGLDKQFHFRAFDTHSITQTRFFDLNKKFLIRGEEDFSGMDLTNVLKFCGFPEDPRKSHNALEDAKLTAECFLRLMFGKNLFPEYAEFKIPRELKK